MSDYKEELRKEWLKYTKPRMTVYNKLTDMEICALCGVSSEKIADWWLSKIAEREQEIDLLKEKLRKYENS